jgi:hypothetical protein
MSMSMDDALAGLSRDARADLERFAAALERIHVDDLPLFAVRPRQPAHRRAVESAALAARERGLEAAVDAAREVVIEYVVRRYGGAQFRTAYVGLNTAPGLGPTEDRVRVMQSLGEAVTAMALGDAIDASDRAELIGAWARIQG